ncbi:CoA pyrophosphatase [Bordetella trematum]|uniref:CoA pyrophosphatase n=1 Tax=Bordetella trematum TaxID=123899 RepID=UPI003AF40273
MSNSLIMRARRPPVRPSFDPQVQPWQSADSGLARVGPQALTPEALRRSLLPARQWLLDPLGRNEVRYPEREGALVMAAVLIPMVMRAQGVSVMLTQRAAHLHDHAGQISFPGGRVEQEDVSPVATALREAQEETGLPQDSVEVLNSMPEYVTATGYAITPVASLVRPGFSLAPDAGEVADVFEVPLSFLMDPANHRLYEARLANGQVRQYYAMAWENRFIWGATAGMLRNLYKSLAMP